MVVSKANKARLLKFIVDALTEAQGLGINRVSYGDGETYALIVVDTEGMQRAYLEVRIKELQ